MRPREAPGALALGLLASLLAHAAEYGGGHSMGGSYHGALVAAGVVAGLGSALAAGALAWAGAGRILEGSILAVRLRLHLPRWPAVAAAAALWFALAEHLAPQHDAASPILLIAGLAIAAWLVLALARGALSILATIAIAVRKTRFSPRAHARLLRLLPAPRAHALLRATRRYARPPPIAVVGA